MIRSVFVSLMTAVLFAGITACSSVKTTAMIPTPTGAVASSILGTGSPTVVLQSGLGDGKDSWEIVFAEIAKTNRVFAYDRPGYGSSPPVRASRDPCSIVEELRYALKTSGLAPPYVLVGHSLGGLYQFVFAKLHPEEVAGLVLLDPTHPDHWRRMQNDAPIDAAIVKMMRPVFGTAMRAEFDDQAQCLERIDMKTPLSKPVRLLTKTQFDLTEQGSYKTMVRSLEDDWIRLLGAKRAQAVAGSGHYIHQDRPDIVIRELRSLIGELSGRIQ